MIISTSCASVVSAVTTVPTTRAVAQHGHAVGDLAHLVEVVRDEQDADVPAAAIVADEREQPLDALAAAGRPSARRGPAARGPSPDRADLLDRAHDREQRALDRLQVARRSRVGSRRDAVAGERLARAGAARRARRCRSASATAASSPMRRFSSTVSDGPGRGPGARSSCPSWRNCPGRERQRHGLAVDARARRRRARGSRPGS